MGVECLQGPSELRAHLAVDRGDLGLERVLVPLHFVAVRAGELLGHHQLTIHDLYDSLHGDVRLVRDKSTMC